jgi:hypothetical protein
MGLDFDRAADPPREAEDVLDLGPQRRLPRWTGPLAAVAMLACVLTVVLVRHDGTHHRSAAAARPSAVVSIAPPKAPSHRPPTWVQRRVALNALLGTTLQPHSPVDSLLVSGRRLYILAYNEVRVYDVRTDKVLGHRSLAGLDNLDEGPSSQLLLDPTSHRLWLLGEGIPPQQAVSFDSRTLRPLGTVRVRADIQAAAAGFGHLYLATNRGLQSLVPGTAGARLIVAHHGGYLSVAVDRRRDRLLLTDTNRPAHLTVVALRRGSRVGRVVLQDDNVGLAVAGDTIWAGGYGPHGAQLQRLDPTTLQPIANSELARRLGPGAVIVAAGSGDVFVQDAGDSGPLWCVDADTGAVQQRWRGLGGAVSVAPGGVYVSTVGGVLALRLRGCGA